MNNEIYDWAKDELTDRRFNPANQVDIKRVASVNPVTGHGNDCMCPRCPGWYVDRISSHRVSAAPSERRPNVLVDQVVPVSILMAMVTVCSVILIPVIAPLLGLAIVGMVAIVGALIGLTVCLLILWSVFRRTSPGGPAVIKGEVVQRRGWLRSRV